MEMGIGGLNSELLEEYSDKDYSIDGVKGSRDALGQSYKTYAYSVIIDDSRLAHTFLAELEDKVYNCVNSIIAAKEGEKPEGASILKRDVVIHWRQYPRAELDSDFSDNPRVTVSFRCTAHHKQP